MRCSAGWWYRPEFVINELNVNSAITTPAHDELIPVSDKGPYTVRGYAYSGGHLSITNIRQQASQSRQWRHSGVNALLLIATWSRAQDTLWLWLQSEGYSIVWPPKRILQGRLSRLLCHYSSITKQKRLHMCSFFSVQGTTRNP